MSNVFAYFTLKENYFFFLFFSSSFSVPQSMNRKRRGDWEKENVGNEEKEREWGEKRGEWGEERGEWGGGERNEMKRKGEKIPLFHSSISSDISIVLWSMKI